MLMGNSLVPRTRLDLAPFQEMLLKTSYLEHSLTWQGPQRSVIRRADEEDICCASLEMTVNKELVLRTQHSLRDLRALSICILLVYGSWQLSVGFRTMALLSKRYLPFFTSSDTTLSMLRPVSQGKHRGAFRHDSQRVQRSHYNHRFLPPSFSYPWEEGFPSFSILHLFVLRFPRQQC